MNWLVETIGLFPLFAFIVFVGIASFQAGARSKEYPTYEQMFRMMVEMRINQRVRAEVEGALQDELNRRSAGIST